MNTKLNCLVLLSLGLAWGLPAADEPKPATPTDKVSYAIGMDIGRNLTNRQVEINPDMLAAGLRAVVKGTPAAMTEEEQKQAMADFQTQMRAKQEERMKKVQEQQKADAEKNKKVGADFLAANKSKPGVVTLPSGLQYKIATTGTGPKPTTNDTVTAHYRGTLIDGTEFDSSYKRGEPTEFAVTGVIKGWTEALLLMPVGSKWQLFIPSELAYGDRAMGPKITPGSTLLFDIELVGIKEKDAKK
jgi:FKBP-type peptidyl-prolyl cis-trans isomerase FklB